MQTADIDAHLAPYGLIVLGSFATRPDDPVPDATRSLALIGPDGGAMWPIFRQSTEYSDDLPDPLNRWSERVLGTVAGTLGAKALFPFGGPPWHPFITWALRSGRVHASPVTLLAHVSQGLFVSFRAALALVEVLDDPSPSPAASPCDTCAEQPCKTACPVGALSTEGYYVRACKAHMTGPEGGDCHSGCLVRRACPVGQGLRSSVQSAFHMQAFLGSDT